VSIVQDKHEGQNAQTSITRSVGADITHAQTHTHTRVHAQVQLNQSSRFVNGADVIHALYDGVLLETQDFEVDTADVFVPLIGVFSNCNHFCSSLDEFLSLN